jgi:hypothetical protein
MIKLFDLLLEIGDSTPMPYKKIKDNLLDRYDVRNLSWEFKIGEDTYVVNSDVSKMDDENWGMNAMFGLKTTKYKSGDTSRTNKGDQYKIMATIFKILKDYTTEHPEIVELSYEPQKDFEGDEQREKLYKIYVNKNFPDWNYTKMGSYVYLNKPKSSVISKIKRFFKK